MAPQVVSLIAREYSLSLEQERARFNSYFEHPFQKTRAIRLAALDGDAVCGFQSYVYWPYDYLGTTLHTHQSGRSIVSPEYRGRGVFAALLDFAWQREHEGVDFLTGFPHAGSYGSLVRNRWENPLDLSWYVRLLHPLSALRHALPASPTPPFDMVPEPLQCSQPRDSFSLSRDPAFTAWRDAYSDHQYYYFHFTRRNLAVRYQLRPNQRGSVSEFVIGDIARESLDPDLLRSSLRALGRIARAQTRFTIISMALNDAYADPSLRLAARQAGFHRIRNKVHFMVKPMTPSLAPLDPRNWFLLRSDIDTW
jgi:GNAT superfamily N-acetyltransferase